MLTQFANYKKYTTFFPQTYCTIELKFSVILLSLDLDKIICSTILI